VCVCVHISVFNGKLVSDLKLEIDKLATEYISNARTLSSEEKLGLLKQIQEAYGKCKEFGDDKVQLAMQTYEMVWREVSSAYHMKSCSKALNPGRPWALFLGPTHSCFSALRANPVPSPLCPLGLCSVVTPDHCRLCRLISTSGGWTQISLALKQTWRRSR